MYKLFMFIVFNVIKRVIAKLKIPILIEIFMDVDWAHCKEILIMVICMDILGSIASTSLEPT